MKLKVYTINYGTCLFPFLTGKYHIMEELSPSLCCLCCSDLQNLSRDAISWICAYLSGNNHGFLSRNLDKRVTSISSVTKSACMCIQAFKGKGDIFPCNFLENFLIVISNNNNNAHLLCSKCGRQVSSNLCNLLKSICMQSLSNCIVQIKIQLNNCYVLNLIHT